MMRHVMPVSFPVIDGREAAGVIDEVGPELTGVAIGDEVFGFAVSGAAAEYAIPDDYASEANHEFLRSLGAAPTTYGEGLAERVRALAPDGVDLEPSTRPESAACMTSSR
jgi:NADPH:quinone reductase-like Zn-dependent oxidoreductase